MGKNVQIAQAGIGQSFGTFGELLQGVLPDNDLDFLVSFPITRYSHVTFVPDPGRDSIEVIPSHKTKTRDLASKILSWYKLPTGGRITVNSMIPVGKGLASSSADLVACARAIDNCYNLGIREEDIQRFLAEIEPSDGVMYPGVTSFYHKAGQLRDFLGTLPHLTVVGIDEGGTIDTLSFNQRKKPFTLRDKLEYQRLLDEIVLAIHKKDYVRVGRISTRSAQLNQKLLVKRTLPKVLDICERIRALGVIVTHSGPCIGLLLSSRLPDYPYKLGKATKLLKEITGEVNIYHSWERCHDLKHFPVIQERNIK
ncbi:GHMP family kinase ATP-binding protein [Thermoactinomyces mirandus]|uniref:Kinase n=1 Tax=Thermoactinomyces mirandus TaxID=2756294 RepID=A0A7W2AQU4_9BACL|nr:kinase [Thermoactinomyces mirandus]MBA4601853.1 kinase [Thermoactinomyces mirandus]